MGRPLLLVPRLLAVAFVAGCSSSSPVVVGDPDAAAAGLTADAACSTLSKARCLKRQTCSPQFITVRDGDQATCEAREKAACLLGLAAPSTGATPTTVDACATATAAATCPELLGYSAIAACTPKSGALTDGAACSYASQCKSTHCAIPKGSACGVCAMPPRAGDSCATLGCGVGLHCGKKSQVCSPFVASGQPCDADLTCGFGLGCVMAKGADKGVCQPLGTEGAPCDPKEQTAAGCDRLAGLWCSTAGAGGAPDAGPAAAGRCSKINGFARGGEACGVMDAATFVACTAGSCAVPQGAGGKGTCVADASEGGGCDVSGSADGASCITGLRCIGATGDAGATGVCRAAATCQ